MEDSRKLMPAPMNEVQSYVPEDERVRVIAHRRRRIVGGGACLGAAFIMLQINEFAFTLAAIALSAILFAYQIHLSSYSRRVKATLWLVILGVGSFWALDTIMIKADKPWSNVLIKVSNPKRYNNNIKILKIQSLPYIENTAVAVNVFYRYDGEEPGRLIHNGCTIVVTGLNNAQAADSDFLGNMEDQQWAGCMPQFIKGRGNLITPLSAAWFTAIGPILTPEQASQLNSGHGAAILIMGYMQWAEGDSEKQYQTEFCRLIQNTPELSVLCKNHNGPIKKVTDSKLL